MYVWYYRTCINNIHFTIVELYLFLSHISRSKTKYINTISIYIFYNDEFNEVKY